MTDHVATDTAIYAALDRGDIPAIHDGLTDDVRWEEWADSHVQKAGVPWLLPRRDKACVVEFFKVVGLTKGSYWEAMGFSRGDRTYRL